LRPFFYIKPLSCISRAAVQIHWATERGLERPHYSVLLGRVRWWTIKTARYA
jgi:hypothetical protein